MIGICSWCFMQLLLVSYVKARKAELAQHHSIPHTHQLLHDPFHCAVWQQLFDYSWLWNAGEAYQYVFLSLAWWAQCRHNTGLHVTRSSILRAKHKTALPWWGIDWKNVPWLFTIGVHTLSWVQVRDSITWHTLRTQRHAHLIAYSSCRITLPRVLPNQKSCCVYSRSRT